MKNLTISRRIILMVIFSVLALLIVGLTGLLVSSKQTRSIQQIEEQSLASIATLGEARQAYMEYRVLVYTHLVNSDPAMLGDVEKRLDDAAGKVMQLLSKYETALASGDEDKKMAATEISLFKNYTEVMRNKVIPLSRNNDKEGARGMIVSEGTALGTGLRKAFGDHMELSSKNANALSRQAIESAAQGKAISIGVILVAVMVIGVFGYFLVINIKQSLDQIQAMVRRVEHDLDFTVRVEVRKQDEIGQTTQALNRLLDKLQGNLKSIAESAQSVASASSLMSTTSTQVATASHEQSQSASDMAATVEEMTVSINHVGEQALEANRFSSESGALAATGIEIIDQTVSDIQDIAATVNSAAEMIRGLENHSQEISNVVSVIRDVAEQTNLLALNAAIEAARAGEQGRGFAVVADEVRKLAERTSSSTLEISETIVAMRTSAGDAVSSMQNVVEKVAKGVESAQDASNSIRRIGESSRTAVGMVEEITSAIREQATATNNIAVQVEHIAQMSEESSAAAGHSADTAENLDRLATDMQLIVSAYKL